MTPAMILALIQASPELLADAIVLSTDLTTFLTHLQSFMQQAQALSKTVPPGVLPAA